MKKISVLLLTLFAIFTLTACGEEETFYTNIDNEELKEMLSSDEEYYFIDVRTLTEYNEKKINGFNLLMDVENLKLSTKLLEDLDKDIPVVLMCNSGNRSVEAAAIFEAEGFTTVYNLEDGIVGWINEDNPVE